MQCQLTQGAVIGMSTAQNSCHKSHGLLSYDCPNIVLLIARMVTRPQHVPCQNTCQLTDVTTASLTLFKKKNLLVNIYTSRFDAKSLYFVHTLWVPYNCQQKQNYGTFHTDIKAGSRPYAVTYLNCGNKV